MKVGIQKQSEIPIKSLRRGISRSNSVLNRIEIETSDIQNINSDIPLDNDTNKRLFRKYISKMFIENYTDMDDENLSFNTSDLFLDSFTIRDKVRAFPVQSDASLQIIDIINDLESDECAYVPLESTNDSVTYKAYDDEVKITLNSNGNYTVLTPESEEIYQNGENFISGTIKVTLGGAAADMSQPEPEPEPEPETITLNSDMLSYLQETYPQNQINYTSHQLGSTITGAESGRAGYSTALSSDGSVLAVGSVGYDLGNSHDFGVGRVRIYGWDSTTDDWVQMGSDISGQQVTEGTGYSVSLNSAGDIVAIGATNSFVEAQVFGITIRLNHGETRIYQYTNGDWVQLGSDISGNIDSQTGNAVSLSDSGTRIAVGALTDYSGNDASEARGSVSVYDWNGTTWTLVGDKIYGENLQDENGYSIDLNATGDTLAIGAIKYDSENTDVGQVRVYNYIDASGWTQIGSDIIGTNETDQTGTGVALNDDGTILAVGSAYVDPSNNGNITMYEYSDASGWSVIGDPVDGLYVEGNSGFSLKLNSSGTIVAAGAPTTTDSSYGRVVVYEYMNSSWTKINDRYNINLIGEEDELFGYSLGMNSEGNLISVGAPTKYVEGSNDSHAGYVKVFTSGAIIEPEPEQDQNRNRNRNQCLNQNQNQNQNQNLNRA